MDHSSAIFDSTEYRERYLYINNPVLPYIDTYSCVS